MTDSTSSDARELARSSSGTFGTRQHAAPEIGLAADVTAAYPTDTGDAGVSVADGHGSLTCACGNTADAEGFAQGGVDGRFGDVNAVGVDPDLTSNLSTFICHSCGRVVLADQVESAAAGAGIPVALKYAASTEFHAAQERYWAALDA